MVAMHLLAPGATSPGPHPAVVRRSIIDGRAHGIDTAAGVAVRRTLDRASGAVLIGVRPAVTGTR